MEVVNVMTVSLTVIYALLQNKCGLISINLANADSLYNFAHADTEGPINIYDPKMYFLIGPLYPFAPFVC